MWGWWFGGSPGWRIGMTKHRPGRIGADDLSRNGAGPALWARVKLYGRSVRGLRGFIGVNGVGKGGERKLRPKLQYFGGGILDPWQGARVNLRRAESLTARYFTDNTAGLAVKFTLNLGNINSFYINSSTLSISFDRLDNSSITGPLVVYRAFISI